MNPSKTSFFVMAVAVVMVGITIGTFLWLKLKPKPPIKAWNAPALEKMSNYGAVPEFSLIERSGKSVSLANLRGKVWIADFIYTNCQDTCPLESATMARLQEQLGHNNQLRLVSFSVDPQHDTPQVLTSYAERYQADSARWLFLTGDIKQITHLVQEGFRLSAVPAADSTNKDTIILHSSRFVLVDRNGAIRGYYDSLDNIALDRLKRDVRTLLKDKGSS
jgi:protein SCO1/2